MGTSTIFQRFNDFGRRLAGMTKKELEAIDTMSAYASEEQKQENLPGGWNCPLELHNRNIEVLLWYEGRLMRLHEAPPRLLDFFYNSWKGKTEKRTKWSVARRMLKMDIERAEEAFRRAQRAKRRETKKKLVKLKEIKK